MKNDHLSESPVKEDNGEIISEYKSFEEFKDFDHHQILEIDQFLKSYAELIYNCSSSELESEGGKVIELNTNQNKLKAA